MFRTATLVIAVLLVSLALAADKPQTITQAEQVQLQKAYIGLLQGQTNLAQLEKNYLLQKQAMDAVVVEFNKVFKGLTDKYQKEGLSVDIEGNLKALPKPPEKKQ
jgi:opacity protein-like surface antigen